MPLTSTVRSVMDKNVQFVEEGSTVADALRTMIEKGVWSVVVLKKGLPMGVVTEHDMLERCFDKGFDANRVLVETIMSSPLLLIDADALTGEAMKKMVEKSVRRLYIVENGQIMGRITAKSVMENTLGVMIAISSETL